MSNPIQLPFANDRQRKTYAAVLAEFRALGYSGDLLIEDYRFGDWFASDVPERAVSAAAFGQLPLSYDTACLAVVLANGESGESRIRQYRSLGAPYVFELRNHHVVKWSLGAQHVHEDMRFESESIVRVFREHANDWSRAEVLRAKNIPAIPSRRPRQLDMFLDTGLIPALEQEIQTKLDPILQDALSSATNVYQKSTGREPDPTALFQLAFRLLAGKVFFDRDVSKLKDLGTSPDPDSIIAAVSEYYGEQPRLPLTKGARQALCSALWTRFDFRNLSIDVLATIWARTFVTPELRKKLGIHRTQRALARYIVDRLPFEQIPEEDRIVVEPCAGSGTFLLAALHRLRDLLEPTMPASRRHTYLRKRLLGFEQELFGVEIGTLCLTLADFPNPNGWQLTQENVFTSQRFIDSLTRARFVLCNPPFEAFPDEVMRQVGARYHPQPAELLSRTLNYLHRDGAIGFVLPHTALDGQEYRDVREGLARRFSDIEIVSLPPESAFETARHPAVLLIAHGQKGSLQRCAITHRKVHDTDWPAFIRNSAPSREDVEEKSDSDARKSLLVPDFAEVWKALQHCDRLSKVAVVHRGIEWNKPLRRGRKETGNRERLIKDKPQAGFRRGIPPRAKPFHAFSLPPTAFLSVRKEDQLYNAFDFPWDKPKVFLNAVRKSQKGRWRLAAAADFEGLLCYQTFTAIWPHDPGFTTPLAAILIGPVANAFLMTHDVRHNRNDTVKQIPMPRLSDRDISRLVELVGYYQEQASDVAKDLTLRQIDAMVLSAYDLPPRLERELLDYFNGSRRQVPFMFANYFPDDFTPCFSLSDYLSDWFKHATAGNFAIDCTETPPVFHDAVESAMRMYNEGEP
ncbi:MAG: N-6 DNA methylase [candidate division Zixibacteria bacterium]|nr:N-6 DNA methylase [candidate division Zixibacteria bacterium]